MRNFHERKQYLLAAKNSSEIASTFKFMLSVILLLRDVRDHLIHLLFISFAIASILLSVPEKGCSYYLFLET